MMDNIKKEMTEVSRKNVEAHVFEQTITRKLESTVLNTVIPMLSDRQLFALYESMVFDMNCDFTASDEGFPEYLFWEMEREMNQELMA